MTNTHSGSLCGVIIIQVTPKSEDCESFTLHVPFKNLPSTPPIGYDLSIAPKDEDLGVARITGGYFSVKDGSQIFADLDCNDDMVIKLIQLSDEVEDVDSATRRLKYELDFARCMQP